MSDELERRTAGDELVAVSSESHVRRSRSTFFADHSSLSMLGLYLHIPFCSHICNYCNFNRGLLDAGVKTRYVSALETEIRRAADGSPADSIFFGGGTPSLLDPAEVERLIRACRESFAVTADAEITL